MNKLVDHINNNYDIEDVYFEVFNKTIPTGKMFCPCPQHNNVNTPAAKRYKNIIHCFSCNKTYTPYHLFKWYMPEKLKEIKNTVILDSNSQQYKKKYPTIPVDRSKPIDIFLNDVLKEFLRINKQRN